LAEEKKTSAAVLFFVENLFTKVRVMKETEIKTIDR